MPSSTAVRVVAQDVAILAGARLGLIRVAQDVLLAVVLGHEAPLQAGREARAATATQAGRLDHVDDVGWRDLLFQDLAQRAVTTGLQVVLVRPRLVEMQRGVDDMVLDRCGTDRAVAFRIVRMIRHLSPVSLQPIEQRVDFRRIELLVVMPVDHHHRRAAARGDAFFLALEVDAAIGSGFAQLAAQPGLGMRDQVLGAVEPAADVGAESDVVAADLFRSRTS